MPPHHLSCAFACVDVVFYDDSHRKAHILARVYATVSKFSDVFFRDESALVSRERARSRAVFDANRLWLHKGARPVGNPSSVKIQIMYLARNGNSLVANKNMQH